MYDPQLINTSIRTCESNNFLFAKYIKIRGVNVPYCSKNLFPCHNAGQNISGGIVCNGALRRIIEEAEKREKKFLEEILEGK